MNVRVGSSWIFVASLLAGCATATDPDVVFTDGGHHDAANVADANGLDFGVDAPHSDGGGPIFDAERFDTATTDSEPPTDTEPPPSDTSTCTPGAACDPGITCKTGTISCATGTATCAATGNKPDGTSCGASMQCSSGVCTCTTGLTSCGGACVDMTSDPSHCGGCGNVCPAGATCSASSCHSPATPVTVDFPNSSDPSFTSSGGGYYWTAGDNVQGSRTTALASTASANVHIAIAGNFLAGDSVDMQMSINGTAVGNFSITAASTSAFDTTLTFPAVAGPTYTLRYEVTRTVAPGDGSIMLAGSGSSVTLNP